MSTRRLALCALALPVVLIACYNPKIPSGTQLCAANNVCPSGYQCAVDDRCYLIGQLPLGAADMAMAIDLTVPDDLSTCSQSTCAAPTPICDPNSGRCVECTSDSNCALGQLCQMEQCVAGCSISKGCADGGGVCDVDAGMCRTCKADGDCSGTPMTPRCFVATGACVPCQPQNDNCGNNEFCVETNGAWACTMGCKVDNDCAAELPDGGAPDGGAGGRTSCCNHLCVDLTVDPSNCGRCGTACMNNNSCCASNCTSTVTDVANCGGCGLLCTGQNASWSCANSACAVLSCMGTFRDCNMNPSDGCESNIISDPNNCLGCGKACAVPNAVPACMQACTIGSCNMGFADCNKNAVDGCEANVTADVNNCGACGKACGTPKNGVAACAMGVCTIASCSQGFADCDGLFANGCEVATTTDPNNCGKCTMKCPAPMNESASCTNSVCGGGSCTAPFKDCDMNANNGCEVNSSSDVNNCGACNMKCGAVANGTPACSASVCGIGTCNAGFADCGKLGNACETNLQTDPANCGKCAMVCPNNAATCVAGVCTAVAAVSCKDILAKGLSKGDGIYMVNPLGMNTLTVYCDMTTDGGGWTLLLNRITESDELGQPDLNGNVGVFDNTRATNWTYDVTQFYAAASDFAFAVKVDHSCSNCNIGGYDSAIKMPRSANPAFTPTCSAVESVNCTKLVGPGAAQVVACYRCPQSLGWGACSGSVCHWGVHGQSTTSDGSWSENTIGELHFPSAHSQYKNYDNSAAYCRSCGGGLMPNSFNPVSSVCCDSPGAPDASTWTMWSR